jgi:hypothetical protein
LLHPPAPTLPVASLLRGIAKARQIITPQLARTFFDGLLAGTLPRLQQQACCDAALACHPQR